jgi:hypothetical protein
MSSTKTCVDCKQEKTLPMCIVCHGCKQARRKKYLLDNEASAFYSKQADPNNLWGDVRFYGGIIKMKEVT